VAIYLAVILITGAAWFSEETPSRDASRQPALPTSTATVPADGNAANSSPAITPTVGPFGAKGDAVPADGNATNKTSVEPAGLDSKTENSSQATTPTVASSAAKTDDVVTPKAACAKAREDVERLEKEKQYSGDDEIVRARMGLPPKPKCQD
jgi:hypothetical protein